MSDLTLAPLAITKNACALTHARASVSRLGVRVGVKGHLRCCCVVYEAVMLRCVLLTSVRAGSVVNVTSSQAPRCKAAYFCQFAARKFANVTNSTGEEEEVRFGDCSGTFSSRKSFRKSSAELQDAKHATDAEVELDEPDHFRSRSKPRRRNTAYWYLLQCKKLLKKDKVRGKDLNHLINKQANKP